MLFSPALPKAARAAAKATLSSTAAYAATAVTHAYNNPLVAVAVALAVAVVLTAIEAVAVAMFDGGQRREKGVQSVAADDTTACEKDFSSSSTTSSEPQGVTLDDAEAKSVHLRDRPHLLAAPVDPVGYVSIDSLPRPADQEVSNRLVSIVLETPSGRRLPLEVKPSDSVVTVKAMIYNNYLAGEGYCPYTHPRNRHGPCLIPFSKLHHHTLSLPFLPTVSSTRCLQRPEVTPQLR